MTYFVQVDAQGRILFAGDMRGSITSLVGYSPDTHKTVPAPPGEIDLCYWDNGMQHMPPQPSPHHRFDYITKNWVLDVSTAWAVVRHKRDALLIQSDWVVLRAADRSEPVPPAWLAYRQALRDVTEQQDPLNIVWPVAPAA